MKPRQYLETSTHQDASRPKIFLLGGRVDSKLIERYTQRMSGGAEYRRQSSARLMVRCLLSLPTLSRFSRSARAVRDSLLPSRYTLRQVAGEMRSRERFRLSLRQSHIIGASQCVARGDNLRHGRRRQTSARIIRSIDQMLTVEHGLLIFAEFLRQSSGPQERL